MRRATETIGLFLVTVFLLAAEFLWLYSPSDKLALRRAPALGRAAFAGALLASNVYFLERF